ncbi:MAG: AraC family transcriptional regulator [Phycisphaerae bacterium]
MIMRYFAGLQFGILDHVPACGAWIDRYFTNFYALNFAAAGRIFWQHPTGKMLELPAPVAWWTWPDTRFVYGQKNGQTWDHYYVTFSGPRARRMFQQGLLRPQPAAFTAVANPQQFRQNFERLIAVLRHPIPEPDQAVYLLEGLCLALQNSPADSQPNTLPRQIEQLSQAIRARPSAPWDFTAEADRLNISLVHLRRLFRQLVGIPIQQYLIRSKMEQAANLLRTTDSPVKQIATSVGYADIHHFTHAFGHHAGWPPHTYRREYRKMTQTL